MELAIVVEEKVHFCAPQKSLAAAYRLADARHLRHQLRRPSSQTPRDDETAVILYVAVLTT